MGFKNKSMECSALHEKPLTDSESTRPAAVNQASRLSRPAAANRVFRMLAASLLPAILILFASDTLSARDYSMSALHVAIRLQDDGSMLVTEDREFTFEGRYSQVFRTFPVGGTASFDQFRIFEGEYAYSESDTEAPGTWKMVERSGEIELQLFFDAADTTRTFRIAFRARGAIARHEDAALLYYQIISDQWTKPIHSITAEIIPPESLPEGEPAHWTHGSLDAESAILDGGTVTARLDRLPANGYWEIRALYPPELFPDLPLKQGSIRPAVMEETAALTQEANRLRQQAIERQERREKRHQTGRQLSIPIALLIIVGWAWLFRKYGKRPEPDKKPGAFSRLPDKEPPALVSYLTNGGYVTGNALISTLFHLGTRGYLKLEEQAGQSSLGGLISSKPDITVTADRTVWEKQRNELLPHEAGLLVFLFDELDGKRDSLSLKVMKKKPTRMQTFFQHWKKAVKKEAGEREWFDRESARGRNIGLVAGAISLIAMLAFTALFGPWMLIPAGVSFLSLFGSLAIYHRTGKGETAYLQWKSLKQHLKRFHFGSGTRELDSGAINEYLVYGLALGLGPGYFKRLGDGLEASGQTHYLYWIVLQQTSLGSFSKTINEVISTTSTTMSSSAGAGGGGTVGGGGGAVSGGGGAR